jgi:serine/threonine protein kinase
VDSRLQLPANTILDSGYRIVRVVGTGGFGITYEAEDINLATQVAIKEYYPFDFGDRDATMSVKPKSERHRQTFDWGRSNFLQEARTLARFEHPSIVRVTRVFEANSTAYMVMRFEQGQSFEAWLAGLGRPPTQEELDAIVAPMLAALELMHSSDFLHRDIAPDNIIVRADGSPVLLDFGAARRAVAAMSRTMTGIVKAGFSPHEQYSSDSRLQGPWSDLYALGGTLYRAVTGHPPEEATLRVDEDHMPSAAQAAWKGRYRAGFLNGIDACLRVRHADRPRSVAQLRPMLLGKGGVSKPRLERLVEAFKSPSKPAPKVPSRPPLSGRTRRTGVPVAQPSSSKRWIAIAAATVAVMGGAYGGYEFSRWQPTDSEAEFRRKTAIEAQRQADIAAAAKRKADDEAQAKAFAEAEAKRQQDEARLAEERARREVEAKRLADAAAANAAAEAKRKSDEEALARRQAEERTAAEKRAAAERVRQEAEAKRLADAAAAAEAKRKADEEALARRQAEERAAAEKRAVAERARQEAEAKRVADAAAAKKKAEDEALARRQAEERVAAEKRAADDRARADAEKKAQEDRVAAIDPGKTEDTSTTVTLNTEERASFVKRVQEVLKVNQCYDGAVNGSSGSEAQKALDRFVDTAHRKGKEKPVRIELAKATASDFDTWLREANDVKGDLCAKPKPVAQKEPRVREREPSRPQQRAQPRSPSYSSGGGGGAPIQGVR